MIKVTLKDGSVKELQKGASVYDAASAISPGLARAAMAGEVDGEVRDLRYPLEADCALSTNRRARRRSGTRPPM